MAQIRRQEFIVSLADIAANPTKVLAENEFLYVRQADGKLKLKCGDGITPLSGLPYSIDIGAAEKAAQDAQISANKAALASGSPKGVYSTFSALQAAFPTGTTGIYVVTDDGKWYYWDGTAWTAGGVYQGTSFEASKTTIVDSAGNFTATDVEGALAETARPYIKGVNAISNMVSFFLDDGYKKDIELALPISVAENVPISIACIANTDSPTTMLSIAEILDLQNNHGWEIVSHGTSHTDWRALTETQLETTMADSKAYFLSNGINVESVCYPLGYYNQLVMAAAKRHYRCGLASIQAVNASPINTYRLSRILVNDFTIDQLKAKVDAMKNNWYIFYSHTNSWVQADVDKYTALIQYVKSKSIAITTVKQGLDIYENKFEINSIVGGKKAAIGADGTTEFTDIPAVYLGTSTGITNDTLITEFPKYKVSVVSLLSMDSSGIPYSAGIGTLTTYRISNNDLLSYQTFKEYNASITHIRTWLGVGWGAWTDIGTPAVIPTLIHGTQLSATAIKNESPITDFPAGKISYATFTAGQSNFPYSSSIGTLITCRLSSNNVLSWQEWREYNTVKAYRRVWTASGWGNWTQTTACIVNTSASNAYGIVNANSSATFDITVIGLLANRPVNVTFMSELPDGIVYVASAFADNTLRIKLYNLTARDINCSTRGACIVQFV